MRNRSYFILGAIVALSFFSLLPTYSQENEKTGNTTPLKLSRALMCEEISANTPRNPTIVFSINRKKAVCYSAFDPVPQTTVIYHNWFHRDVPSAKIRLTLRPPRWSTFSSIQLRKTDIGPWRVEITDEKGNILGTLRFSVTD